MKRPPLRYHGGKFRAASRIVAMFPSHRIYVEPYGGAASVLMHKARSYAEVYNDLDSEVVNVFRVLRDPESAEQLENLLRLTPFARDEFMDSYVPSSDPVEQARRTIIKSFMGFGSAAITAESASIGMRTRAFTWRAPTGFRSNSSRSGTTPAHDWAHYPDHIRAFTERLQGVVIENRDAASVIKTHDRHDALIYCDPPYVKSTRSDSGDDYRHEMTDEQHAELAAVLHDCTGAVIISGYASELYDSLYAGWRKETFSHLADGAKRRVECLWLNEKACAANPRLLEVAG